MFHLMRQIQADKKAKEVTKKARVTPRIKKRKLEDMKKLNGPGTDAALHPVLEIRVSSPPADHPCRMFANSL
ncbi:hypothetical protein J6590_026190 [Homalodisca vitripennis]|nr:hypothetical protein J6590_026190 [Homalodisca vitripennis]